MADPLSAAGSAVGVISLGLTVCQGVLAYYGPFKAFHEQVDEVACRIAALDGILKALQHVLTDAHVLSASETAPSAAVGIDTILDCQEGLNKLRKMLEKCDKTKQAGSSIAPKKRIDRLSYPFRRETLKALMETTSWLQANLDTSLQMLNM
ncbi:hypothetical protein EYZ11_013356 [Aspergillus tanneri]|uniref:Fungal N-terminal domain-containing protein n=1 Tax=Aspergillus tanneri TaxID=1220188 RepID=A0A4S3J027_9EURO|nr:uncharacterized protein ATNIH1004_006482 [Aspergillus tanneri]KAA8647781.1 hypothetical protein ATNIH1004_006482 [Aspergillus tanneri]THC87198.1 hypothetical protein EYZ11_013356 [Aspergillus tanneri]